MNKDIFWFIDMMCELTGGIGSGPVWMDNKPDIINGSAENYSRTGNCMMGLVLQFVGYDIEARKALRDELERLDLLDDSSFVGSSGINFYTDKAVAKAQEKHLKYDTEKISWKEFCEYHNIVPSR